MVKHWFNCKVSSRTLDSEGAEVKKVEQFVLDAYTYTEAETRMTQICEYEGIRPFEITQLTKTNLIEVIRYPEMRQVVSRESGHEHVRCGQRQLKKKAANTCCSARPTCETPTTRWRNT